MKIKLIMNEKQKQHLEKIYSLKKAQERNCLHNGCQDCSGTGLKSNGALCIHMISCNCFKCSPVYF